MEFNQKQQAQEDDYKKPNHWFVEPDIDKGRIYNGYLSICQELAGDKKAAILDAGCGDAAFLGRLAEAGYTNLTGIDYSERAINFARLLAPSVHFRVGDLVRLPFEDGDFDTIFCIETVEHLIPDTIPGILAEFKRVLKPGGRLVITVPSIANGIPSPESKHYQHFSVESLSAYISPLFTIEEIKGQDYVLFHPLKLVYRLITNSWWDLPKLRSYYNLQIWPKYFNRCEPRAARRLIAVCRK